MDLRREEHEADYLAALLAALRTCAAGSWGLFDHKPDRSARARVAPVIAELTDLAGEIDDLRDTLGLEPFPTHPRFLAARGPVASNEPGEPKQAQAWLDALIDK